MTGGRIWASRDRERRRRVRTASVVRNAPLRDVADRLAQVSGVHVWLVTDHAARQRLTAVLDFADPATAFDRIEGRLQVKVLRLTPSWVVIV